MADTQAARELELFIANDRESYRHLQEVHKNAVRKALAGKYDPRKAVKLFMYTADIGAKRYTKEFDRGARTSFGAFDKATRTLVAKSLRDDFESAYRRGELDAYTIKEVMPAAYKRAGWSGKRVREYAGTTGLPKKPPKTMTEAFEAKKKRIKKRGGPKGSAKAKKNGNRNGNGKSGQATLAAAIRRAK